MPLSTKHTPVYESLTQSFYFAFPIETLSGMIEALLEIETGLWDATSVHLHTVRTRLFSR